MRRVRLILGVLVFLALPESALAQFTVTLSPSSATVAPTQTVDFTAVVTGTSNKAITKWMVCNAAGKACVNGGNSTIGTLVDTGLTDGSGNHIGRYTAPAAVPSPPACSVVSNGCQLRVKVTKKVGTTVKKASAPVTIEGAVITTSALGTGRVGEAYEQTLLATGGAPPYSWSITSGALPGGLSLNSSTGAITGTPGATGTSNFTARVQESAGTSNSRAFSISVVDSGVLVSLMPSVAGVSLNQTADFTAVVTGTTNKAINNWQVCDSNGKNCVNGGNSTLGTIVDIGADADGDRIGRYTAPPALPAASACFPVTSGCYLKLRVIKKVGTRKKKSTATVVLQPGVIITTTSLPDAVVGVTYNQAVAQTNGLAPFFWEVISGALPAGMGLNSGTGVISGPPTTANTGGVNFTVRVTDSRVPPTSDSQALSIRVADPLTITTSSLPGGTAGTAYSQTLAATGGILPRTWDITAGSLPASLGLGSSTGTISGTPTTPGTSIFTARVRDSSNPQQSDTADLSITIDPAPLIITTTSLPNGTVTVSYNQTLNATGGTLPFAWSEPTSSFDAGTGAGTPGTACEDLTFNSNGTITGTPVNTGTCGPFTARVDDSAAQFDEQTSLQITVNANTGQEGLLYVGGNQRGHIFRWNNASTKNGIPAPNGTINDGTVTGDILTRLENASPFGLAVDTANDRLYVANFGTLVLGVLVFDNASAIAGTQNDAPERTLSGSNTLIDVGIRGVAVDTVLNKLYVGSSTAIRVWDNASGVSLNTAPTCSIEGGTSGLNFPHGLFVDTENNRLYVANAGTVGTGANSIAVFDSASTCSGSAPERTLSGPITTLNSPKYALVDTTRDKLYVANANANSILIWDSASLATGPLAPSRTIVGGTTQLSAPCHLALDVTRDELYVGALLDGTTKILVFSNISTANGNVAPSRVINMPTTPDQLIGSGVNGAPCGVALDTTRQ